MRLIPGDNPNDAEITQWPIRPLTWWRGEMAYRVDTELPESDRHLKEWHKGHGVPMPCFEVDMEHGQHYTMTLGQAQKIFREYAQVGHLMNREPDFNQDFSPLKKFMCTYGVPCDFADELAEAAFADLYRVTLDLLDAALCSTLVELATGSKWAQIRQLADFTEADDGCWITFNLSGERWKRGKGRIFWSGSPDDINSRTWIKLALEVARIISMRNAPSVRVVDEQTKHGGQLALASNGLKSSLWLAFRLTLNDAYNFPELTKTCLSDEFYHGCGRQFVAANPREKLCPDCRRKAKTEAQARWRAKQKEKAK